MKKIIKFIGIVVLSFIMMLTSSFSVLFANADDISDLESIFDSILNEDSSEDAVEEEFVAASAEEALNAAVIGGEVIGIENSNVKLQLNKTDGCLYVTDKSSNKIWLSNPFDAEQDELASGVTRTNLRAQLVVNYIENKSITSTNNYVSSVNRGGAKYKLTENSIRADYEFVDEGFAIPVEYVLTDKGFTVNVLFDEIVDTEERRVHQIEVLPYFGAAGINEEGYMLIPDGSGALVEFNNGKQEGFPFEKAFYGGDKAQTPNTKTSVEKNLLLPVYGIKSGENAFVAIVSAGAQTASLYACVSGKQSNYNRIYTKTVYRAYDTVNLEDSIGKSVYAKYIALNQVKLPVFSVDYTLLSGEKADYVGMAEPVRKWLTKEGLKKSDMSEPQLFVDFYGAVEKEKAFLGIRYTGVQKLTSFENTQMILEKLKAQGVDNIAVGYKNFSTSDYKNKLASKVSPASELGGKKGYSALLDYAKKNNISIYPYADFVTFKTNGNSYWSFSDVVLGLQLSVIKRYDYRINDGVPDESSSPWYLVSANRYKDAKKQLLNTLDKYGSTGVLLDESANYIYNDFSPDGYQVDRTVASKEDIYKAIQKQGQGLMLSAPNAYAMTYAELLTDMPMTSSQYAIFDGDIPFLQIVLKGTVSYSSEALNIDGVSDVTLLSLIETGSQPKFAMVYEDGKKLLGTDLNHLYGATYTACMSTVEEYYQCVSAVAEKTQNAKIINHTKKDDLVTVSYENGVTVYINYSKNNQSISNGTVVPALSYIVEG